MKKNAHLGSSLDDLLREDGTLEEVTSRSALDRLLDPFNASVTLYTLTSAARALGSQLELRLTHARRSSARATARRASEASARKRRA